MSARRTVRDTIRDAMRDTVRRLGAAAAVGVAAAACVEIATGPGGVASVRLDRVPPSIIVGDVLRDSTGAPTAVRAVAFDDDGAEMPDAPLRYLYVPLREDTTGRDDRAIVVDSLTGTARAAGPPFVATRGRLGVRIGDRLQVFDTVAIVPRPDSLARGGQDTAAVRRLVFDCRDAVDAPLANVAITGAAATNAGLDSTWNRIGNNTTLSTVLTGDSAGTRRPVPRYLVRYVLVAPTTIPMAQPTRGPARPAIGLVDGTTDTPLRFDTTDAAGTAAPRLRLFPPALTRAAFPGDSFDVRVRAFAVTAPGDTAGRPVEFLVRLRRLTRSTVDGAALACP